MRMYSTSDQVVQNLCEDTFDITKESEALFVSTAKLHLQLTVKIRDYKLHFTILSIVGFQSTDSSLVVLSRESVL